MMLRNEVQETCDTCYDGTGNGIPTILDIGQEHKCMSAMVGVCPKCASVVDLDRVFRCSLCGTTSVAYPKPKYERDYSGETKETIYNWYDFRFSSLVRNYFGLSEQLHIKHPHYVSPGYVCGFNEECPDYAVSANKHSGHLGTKSKTVTEYIKTE